MTFEYGIAKYTLREAADATGFALNTLRSFYAREHFRIVGGEDKKGRGLAALLTLEDVLCIGAAKALVDAGVHPRTAFNAGVAFAYVADGNRHPAGTFGSGFTVLICHPSTGHTKIVNMKDSLGFADLFTDMRAGGRHAAIVVLLDDVEKCVLGKLTGADGGNAASQEAE